MAQLLVRDLEAAVVERLRHQAAAQGISMEEAHRRLLRSALLGKSQGPERDFLSYLRSIPHCDEVDFSRQTELPRSAEL